MDELKRILEESMNIDMVTAVISNPRIKSEINKIKVRPILKKGTLLFQFEIYTQTQVFHENHEVLDACQKIETYMNVFRQIQLSTKTLNYTVLISKKGKVTIQKKRQITPVKEIELSHNKKKHYILEEGTVVPFLVDLGVMGKDGFVIKSKFDKFRQINRFLEFIEDVLPKLPTDREITILDFGCGKSYLTFAMYYYLHELKGIDVNMIGLDLKTEVILHCNEWSAKYGYEKLHFLEGNIADYTGQETVDMVVTLHACDTATDYALAKAVAWGAKVILSVPCCQHELNGQIENELLEPVLRYGLIKERMAALVTDALRAEYLVGEGYDAQILEFIDMEHTPKNILIRAVKTEKEGHNQAQLRACAEFLQVSPMLGKLLEHKGEV